MKRMVAFILALAMCLCLCGCGKSEAVIAVEQRIELIGEVTLDSEDIILSCEEAYEALGEYDREKVENYTTRSDARATYDKIYEEEQKRIEEETEALLAEIDEVLNWQIGYYVDEFGDAADDAYIACVRTGTFSNSATMGSDFTVGVFYSGFGFSFRLLEYGNMKAYYSDDDVKEIGIKIDGQVYSAELDGLTPTGDLFFLEESLFYKLYKALQDSEEIVSCCIKIGDSDYDNLMGICDTYNFTIQGRNFADIKDVAEQ